MNRFENLEFDDGPAKQATPSFGQAKGVQSGAAIRNVQYYQSEAEAAYYLWDFEGALRSYSRALEDDHKAIPCWVGQLRALIELGEYKEALLWAKKALELFPDHPELVAAQAVAAARSGMMSVAIAHCDLALTRDGITPFVWLARGEVLLAARRKMAEHCFGQALALAQGERAVAWVKVEIARVLMRYKRQAQAMKYAEPAVETLADESGAWLVLGLCQAGLGLRKSISSLERALELNPDCKPARQAIRQFKPRGLFGGLKRMMGLS